MLIKSKPKYSGVREKLEHFLMIKSCLDQRLSAIAYLLKKQGAGLKKLNLRLPWPALRVTAAAAGASTKK